MAEERATVAGLRIDQLPSASTVEGDDFFVLQQNAVAKKLPGSTLIAQLAAALDGHGGIQSIEKTETKGLVDTFTVTFADGTTASFTVTNGRSINGVQYAGVVEDTISIQIAYNDGTTEVMPVTLPKKYEGTPFDIIDLPRNQTQDRYVRNADGTVTSSGTLKLFSAIVPCPRYLGWKLTEKSAVYLYIFKKINGEYIIDTDYEFATYKNNSGEVLYNYLSYVQKEYGEGSGAYNRFIETEDRYFCYRISAEGDGVTLLGADEWPEGMTENIAVAPDSVSPKRTHLKNGANYSVVLPEGCAYAVRIADSAEYSHRDFNVSVVYEEAGKAKAERISNGASFGVIPSGQGAALLTIPGKCPLKNVSIYTSKFVEVSSVGGRRQKARDMAQKLIRDFSFESRKNILWNDSSLPLQEGKRFYGVPYSSRWVNSHYVGFEVSIETALNALDDPYSIAYDGGKEAITEQNETASASWFPSVSGSSEISRNDEKPKEGGGPGYGLVCSAFTSLIFGNPYPQTNRGFTFDRNFAIVPMTTLVSGTIAVNKGLSHCVMVDELYREGYSILEAADPCVAKTVHTNTKTVDGALNSKTRISFLDNYMYAVANLDDSGYGTPLLKFPTSLPNGVVRPWRGHKSVYGPWDKDGSAGKYKGSGIGVTIHPTPEQTAAGTVPVIVSFTPLGENGQAEVLNTSVLATTHYLDISGAVSGSGTYKVSCGDGNPEEFRYYAHDPVTLSFDAEGRAVFSHPDILYAYVSVRGYGSGLTSDLGNDTGGMVIAAGKLYPDLAADTNRIRTVYAAIAEERDKDGKKIADYWGRYSVVCSQDVTSEYDPGTSGGSGTGEGPLAQLKLTDAATGKSYSVYVNDGKLTMKEV